MKHSMRLVPERTFWTQNIRKENRRTVPMTCLPVDEQEEEGLSAILLDLSFLSPQ